MNPACDRCYQTPANLLHMFWSCPHLQHYWAHIFTTLSSVINLDLQPDPLLALFGVPPHGMKLPKLNADFVAFLTLLARRRILLCWKSPSPPSYEAWIRDAVHFSKLKKIRLTLHASVAKFFKVWQPFLDYIRTLQSRDIPP